MGKVQAVVKLIFVVGLAALLSGYSISASAVGQSRFLADIEGSGGGGSSTGGGSVIADVGGKTYIRVLDSSGAGLWVTDGTSTGTERLLSAGSNIDFFELEFNSVHNGIVYFSSSIIIEGETGVLLATDGTPAGTTIVKNFSGDSVNPDFFTSFPGVGPIFWHNNIGYFGSWDSDTGSEFWRTDGTTSGTVLIKDIVPGRTPFDPDIDPEDTSVPLSSSPREFFVRDGTVYFVAAGRLYQTDGSEVGTTIVGGLSISDSIYMDQDRFVFKRNDGRISMISLQGSGALMPVDLGSGFVRVDGARFTGDGRVIGDVNTNTVFWNGSLYFVARKTAVFGGDLWISNLSANSATLLKVIRPGDADIQLFSSQHLINDGTELYFWASDGIRGREPWKTDGTPAGTQILRDVRAGSRPSITGSLSFSRSSPIVVNNRILTTLFEDTTGFEFWVTNDGSTQINLLKDIKLGSGSSYFTHRYFQNVNGRFYFEADNGINGRQLWTSDATSAGTQMVDVLSGNNINFLRSRGKNTLLYTTYQASSGFFKLWAYDLDVDGDNVIDAQDNCPEQANASQADFDRDGFGDACDSDADNDGLPAEWEQEFGFNDLNPSDAALDSDGDGINNLSEFIDGTNPLIANPDCNNDGVPDSFDLCAVMSPIYMMLLGENSLPMISIEEGTPGEAIITISDDKANFDYVIALVLIEDSQGLIVPPGPPYFFITGNSGSSSRVELRRFFSEQSTTLLIFTVTDSDGEVVEEEISFAVP